jgi:hypothetical protein
MRHRTTVRFDGTADGPVAAMLAELLPQLDMRYLGRVSYIEDRAFWCQRGGSGLGCASQEAESNLFSTV